MDLALYCPVFGYYEAEGDKIGRRGDYYTSVSVGNLFGELLACQFAEWLGEGPARMIEAGAHRAELARDILVWLRANRPGLFGRLKYVIVEPSERRRAWQRQTLGELAGTVQWQTTFAEQSGRSTLRRHDAPQRPYREVIFANELLDSMPVQRLGWNAKERTWFEWGVGLKDGRFAWQRMPKQPLALAELLEASSHGSIVSRSNPLADVLPDGFILECCPTAIHWWHQAAQALPAGKLLTIDYGLTADEFLSPERTHGTLRGYFQHSLSNDLLANPGRQDLTAQVNFTALQAKGEAAGLKTEAFSTQAQFLISIAARTWSGELAFGEWTPERKRQFQTLTHPEHLGRAFRVLVQSREVG